MQHLLLAEILGLAMARRAADILDRHRAAAVLAGFGRRLPAIRHARREAPPMPVELAEATLGSPALDHAREREGRDELGTLGRGNHFVELQADEHGHLWLMLHSGSRAMGQLIRDHHLRGALEGPRGLKVLLAESEAGHAYGRDREWALAYADANRRALLRAATEVIGEVLAIETSVESAIQCHHNHVRAETHLGETWWVHRKGAIPAAAGELGIVPGSMGSASYHVSGRGEPGSLASSAHGAGRLFSRSEARRRISVRTLEHEMSGIWFDHRLLGRLCDEAPSAYKDIGAVMRAQRDLTRIVRKLRPVLSYKGT